VSSSRERNDRSRPLAKPFSKGPKDASKPAGKPSEKPFAKPPGKPAFKGRGPRREPEPAAPAAYDPAKERAPREHAARAGQRRKPHDGSTDWLWGWHAVQAALANPNRAGFKRLLVAPAKAHDIQAAAAKAEVRFEQMENQDITRHLPPGTVHQGVALLAEPLEGETIESFADDPRGLLLMLDQLTDPQNVGAIFRSAAAFGARGVVLQDRHAPLLTGALAKAAAGAVDALPHARVINLSRALELLAEGGWRVVGLDGSASQTLEEALDNRPTVLVLGSEGEGLRRLVAEHCDTLARIPMPGGFESLNVSNAAAIALYEASRKQR